VHVCVCVCVHVSVCVGEEQISKAQLRLTDIAEHLESDWVPLARQLGITADEIVQIQRDYQYVVEQVRLAALLALCVSSTAGL